MAKFSFDIESTGLADLYSIDYTKPYQPLLPSFKIHCIVAQDIDTMRIFAFYNGDTIRIRDHLTGKELVYTHLQLDDFKRVMKSADSLIGHNIINYDLFILKKFFGDDFGYTVGESVDIPDTVAGHECFIDDTLVKSKLLYPDRRGGHSLDAFGKKLGFRKGNYGKVTENAWEKFSPEMLAYCIDDVRLTTKVHTALLKEWGNWNWDDAYCLEKAVKEIVTRGEQYGFYFDKELAQWCVCDLNEKMAQIEADVEPLLPRKTLPISQQPTFPAKPFTGNGDISSNGWKYLKNTLGYPVNEEALALVQPPKTAFKKDGTLSETGKKWCIKHDVTDEAAMPDYIRSQLHAFNTAEALPEDLYNKAVADLRNKVMPDITVPMKLSDQKEMKEYLVTLGWDPQVWSEDDLRMDKKTKKSVPMDVYKKRVENYVKDTLDSVFCKARCDFLECTPETLRSNLLARDIKRPVKKYGSPKYTIDKEKTIDPNLLKLGEKVAWVTEVVHWLTFRHRRNAIHSPPNASKKHWSGWLANPRIDVDHRIPTPADTCGCSTGRFTHIDVCNVPRVTSEYGEYMRALFGVDTRTHLQVGMDFDGLEAKIEAHYCYPYAGGPEYGESLTAAKPNDVHTVNAKKMDVPRDTAKTLKYACMPVENTVVLTPDGWKGYSDLCDGDAVLSYNTESGVIERDVILKTHFYPDADVIDMHNSRVSLESTEDHRWFGKQRRSKGHGKNTVRYFESGFKRTSEINSEFNILCSAPYTGGNSEVSPEDAAVIGWLLSDGYYKWKPDTRRTSSANGRRRGLVGKILQAQHKYYKELEHDLKAAGADYTIYVRHLEQQADVNDYCLSSEWLRTFLDRVVGCRQDKHDTDWVSWVLRLTNEARTSFLKAFWLADGTAKGREFNKNMIITQNTGNIFDAVQLAMYFTGKLTLVTKHDNNVDRQCMNIRQSSNDYLTCQRMKKDLCGKKDVFCITTNNGTFIAKQKDFITITGNCTYGAQPPKVAKQMGWTLSHATQVFDAFWDAASPLRDCKNDLKTEWEKNGKKYIVGIDGRKIWIRSPHSICNALFQSAGVTCAKRAAVWWDRQIKKENIEGVHMMIMYHDEQQTDDLKENVKFKMFDNKEDATAWKKMAEDKTGRKFSDVGHKDDQYFVAYCRSGELAALSCEYASRYYNLNITLTGGYIVGANWRDCH